MKILMILADRDFPPDIRVEKEIRSLRIAGHKTTIICSKFGQDTNVEYWDTTQIIRVPKASGLNRKISTARRILTFNDQYWSSHIENTITSIKPEILHVHDLPMLGTAINIGKRHNLPVIADFHENYPAALEYYRKQEKRHGSLIQDFYFSPKRWQAYEKRCAMLSNHIIVVVKEARERIIQLGITADKITTIENTVDIRYFESLELDHELINKYKDRFVISYIGGFGGWHRGLDTAIMALPKIKNNIPNALLLLVGDGNIKENLLEMVTTLSLQNYVNFIPWQPFDKVPSYISLSHVCIIPHHSNPHTDSTSPHKLFQYMLMNKPIVTSDCKPLKRIINETQSGLVFTAGNHLELAEQIIILKDSSLRKRLGEAGKKAVLSHYNWEETSKKLYTVYEQFLPNQFI